MSCNDVRERLDDYVDGGLDERTTASVRRHLSECENCRDEEQQLRELLDRLADLPRSIEPSPQVWAALSDGLDAEDAQASANGWPHWRTLAAACVGIVLIAVGYFARDFIEPPPADRPHDATSPQVILASKPLPTELAFIEVQRELRAELDRRRPHLSAETIRTVESNLEVVEASILEIRRALEADPGNRELSRLLVSAHQREIGLLRQVTQMMIRL